MRLLAKFDDFSGGELGYASARKSPRNMWTGLNVMAYPDRSIGPRSGLVRLVANSGGAMPNTGFHRIGWTKVDGDSALGRVWWIGYTGGEVKYGQLSNFDAAGGAWSSYGTISGTGASRVFGSVNTKPETTYVVGSNTELFRINHSTNNLTTFGAGTVPKGRCIALYGNRLYVGAATYGGTGNDARVHFSSGSNVSPFINWDANGWFDLPVNARIVAMFTQRDHLVIVQATGNIWIYSGVPGASSTLRGVTGWAEYNDVLGLPESGAVVSPNAWVKSNDGTVWWCPPLRPYPSFFDGGQIGRVDRLRAEPLYGGYNQANAPSLYPAAALDDPRGAAFSLGAFVPWNDAQALASSQRFTPFLVHANGAWSRHAADTLGAGSAPFDPQVMCQGPHGSVLMAGTWDDTERHVYVWQPSIVRPPLHHVAAINGPSDLASPRDNYLSYGSANTEDHPYCEFTTVDVDSSDGGQFRVRRVIVRFTAYNTADTANTNHWEMTIVRRDVFGQPDASGTTIPSSPTVLTWDLASSSIATSGERSQDFTVDKGFDSGRCGSFAVKFSDVRGVKINEVLVFGDIEQARVN
jgi:hypothetical protein